MPLPRLTVALKKAGLKNAQVNQIIGRFHQIQRLQRRCHKHPNINKVEIEEPEDDDEHDANEHPSITVEITEPKPKVEPLVEPKAVQPKKPGDDEDDGPNLYPRFPTKHKREDAGRWKGGSAPQGYIQRWREGKMRWFCQVCDEFVVTRRHHENPEHLELLETWEQAYAAGVFEPGEDEKMEEWRKGVQDWKAASAKTKKQLKKQARFNI